MSTFAVVVDHLNGTAILRLKGELDLATAPQLEATLGELLKGGHRSVTLDMSGCTFADCAGLRPIRRARREATDLRVTGAEFFVQRVLSLTGLEGPMAPASN